MKKSDVGLLLYVVGLITALVLVTGCVAKHPKCAAYDKIEHDPLIKTNLDRSLYK